MKNKTPLVVAAVIIALATVFFITSKERDSQKTQEIPTPSQESQEAENSDMSSEKEDVEASARNTVVVKMDSGNFYFTPAELKVKKGETVRIEFVNMGRHTFVIDELGIKETMIESSGTFEFTADKAGTFKFYCDVPGHQARGMEGTIIIEE